MKVSSRAGRGYESNEFSNGLAIVLVLIVFFAALGGFFIEQYYYTPIGASTSYSAAWAGYVVTGTRGSVSNVSASWMVPSLNCSGRPDSCVLVWVGIVGQMEIPGINETVEQIGTRGNCSGGHPSYFAWYEFWPLQNNTIQISNVTVRAGDTIAAWVSGSNSSKDFQMWIGDTDTQTSTFIHGNYSRALLLTADWIAEAPGYPDGTKLIMANFTNAEFENPMATVNGKSSQLLSFVEGSEAGRLVYVCPDDTLVKAQPNGFERVSNSFAIQWLPRGDC